MPYTIVTSESEAAVAKTAGVGEVEGVLFTYKGADSMAIIAKLSESEDDAALRLAGRIATLVGRQLVEAKVGKTEDAKVEQEANPSEPLALGKVVNKAKS